MKRYLHSTLLFLVVYVFASSSFLIFNSDISITWADDENVENAKDEPLVPGEDDSHLHAEDSGVTLSDKAKANIGLKTAEVDIRTIEKVVQVPGNIIAHPGKQGIVTPRIGGIVKQVHFNLGDMVKKGEVLLELESIDLKLAEIDLIEAVHQRKSLDATLAKQKSVFAQQIRLELQTQQIDYLESLTQLQEQKNVFQKHRSIAIAKTISALEQMRVELIKSDIERRLIEKTLSRIKSLTELRISAQKELIAQQAAYTQATNAFAGAQRQFQLLGVSEQTLQKILSDDGSTDILSLLDVGKKNNDKLQSNLAQNDNSHNALKYVNLIEEASALVDAESAYKSANIKVKANKQRAIAAGMTVRQLETLTNTGKIESFKDLSADKLIEKYAPFMTSSETFEALMQTEEAQRNATIVLEKVRQQLEVYGMTAKEIDKIIESGKSHSRVYVTAPTSGQIIKQEVILGATVAKSDTLYSILDTDVVWVEGEVYEDTLLILQGNWKVGSAVRVRVPAYPGKIFTGKIARISTIVEPGKRTVHFWTEVDNATHQLKPGMFADQTLVIETLDDVLSIPLHAVLEDGATKIVFVESGNTYDIHEVEVGAKDDQYIEIKDGLLAGEMVVIQGNHQLLRASAGSSAVVDPHAGHSH